MKYLKTPYSITLGNDYTIDLDTIEIVKIKDFNFANDKGQIYQDTNNGHVIKSKINGEVRYCGNLDGSVYMPVGGEKALKDILDHEKAIDFLTSKENYWIRPIAQKDIDKVRNKWGGSLTLKKLTKLLQQGEL